MRPSLGAGVRVSLVAGVLAALLVAGVPMVHAATPVYLTTNVTESGLRQATIDGYPGALVNVTNNTPAPMQAFVYVVLTNHAGQTVYWNFGACTLASAELTQCFVPFLATLSGNYTATAFTTTDTNVPVSASVPYSVSS